MDTNLYLIRHAQSQPKSSQHYSSWKLSPRGARQSEQLAKLLEPLGIQKIFSSPFIRCLETIEPFARKSKLQILIVDELRERLVAKEITDGFYGIWCRSWDDFDFALPGCETSNEAQKRFTTAVKDIAAQHEQNPIAISTHGNVIGLFLNWIDGSVGRADAERLRNPDVIRVVKQNGKFVWDRVFSLRGLEEVASDHQETVIEKDE